MLGNKFSEYFKLIIYAFLIFVFILSNTSNAVNSTNEAFFKAIETGDIAGVESLLKSGVDVNIRHDRWGITALTGAAGWGKKEIVKLLLVHGANIEFKDGYGHTPLMSAAKEGHLDVVKVLLAHGAEINVKSGFTSAPLWLAAEKGHKEVVKLLLKEGSSANVTDRESGESILHRAAGLGHLEIVKTLIDYGANVNHSMQYGGSTPLINAAMNGHYQVVKILLEHGAKINKCSDVGTPLSVAVESRHIEIIKLLLTYGADGQYEDEYCKSALEIAKQKGDKDIIELLQKNSKKVPVQ